MTVQKTGLAILLNLLVLSAVQANCQVFEHANYQGATLVMSPGQHISNVGTQWNDRISAVQVTNKCSLTVFQHANYQGDKLLFKASSGFVGNLWNDQISSLQCQCPEPPKPSCTLYEHANFAGGSFSLRGTMPWVGEGWNDKVSAVKVPESCHLTVYQHKDLGGDSRAFTPGSTAYIGDLWNDQVSSAICSCR